VKSTDEEGLKRKEQSILKLGTLLQQQVLLCNLFCYFTISCYWVKSVTI